MRATGNQRSENSIECPNPLYHIVFSTKDRQPLITPHYEPRLYDYIGGMIREMGGISLALNGTADHVHLLAKLSPVNALADALRHLKAHESCVDAQRVP